MRIGEGTTIGDVAKFLADKGDKMVVAKKVNGQVELYTKSRSNVSDYFTKTNYNGTWMSSAQYKKQLAKDTIQNLIVNYQKENTGTVKDFEKRAGFTSQISGKLTELIKKVESNVRDGDLKSSRVVDSFGAIEKLTQHVTNVLTRVEVPPIDKTMPQTENRPLDATVNIDVPPGNVQEPFPKLQIDGKEYTPKKVLGEGANGRVVLYEPDEGEPLAVKLPFPDVDAVSQRDKALEEYHIAKKLTDRNPNVIGFNKVVPFEDGTVAIAGKLAPHGDLEGLRTKLNLATIENPDPNVPLPPGHITKRERQLIALTLIQDAASGLDKIERNSEHIHADVKTQNLMINKDGRAVVVDLGEAIRGTNFNPNVNQIGDNYFYAAPEIGAFRNKAAVNNDPVVAMNKDLFREEVKDLAIKLGMKEDDFEEKSKWLDLGDKLTVALKSAYLNIESQKLGKPVDSKVDVWGLGTVAFELLVGERLTKDKLEADFSTADERKVQTWAKSNNLAIGTPNGLSSKSTGDDRLDLLINKMLDSNVQQRISASDVKNDPLMTQTTGVGSTPVRELIKALASDNVAQITQARENLARFLGTD